MLNKMRLPFLLLLLTAINGCGLKGPLYLEDEQKAQTATEQELAQDIEKEG